MNKTWPNLPTGKAEMDMLSQLPQLQTANERQ